MVDLIDGLHKVGNVSATVADKSISYTEESLWTKLQMIIIVTLVLSPDGLHRLCHVKIICILATYGTAYI